MYESLSDPKFTAAFSGPNCESRTVKVSTVFGAPYGESCAVVRFVKLHPDAETPRLGTEQSAGYDLVTPSAVTLLPGERKAIPLGLAMAFPPQIHGRIESRSGLALKGLVVLTGVIDSDYRGEVKVIMQNFSNESYEFAPGDRVAQLVLRPTLHRSFVSVESLEDTERGSGGFGSTGQ